MNKRKHLQRKEIKGPDAFQSTVGRLVDEGGRYLRMAAITLAVALVAGVIVWSVRYNSRAATARINADLRELASRYEDRLQQQLAGESTEWRDLVTDFEALYQRADSPRLRQLITAYVVNSYIAAGEYDAAIGAAQDLSKLAGDRNEIAAYAFYLRGKAQQLRGQRTEAQESFQTAAQISPNPLGEFLEQEFKRASAPPIPPQVAMKYLAPAADEQGEGE